MAGSLNQQHAYRNGQFSSPVQRQSENRTNWNFPTQPRENQQIPVNAHSQRFNDFTTPNRFGAFTDDNPRERVSAAGKQKARSPLDEDLTLKKQKANGDENEGIEMETYSMGVTDLVSDNVSVPGSIENGDSTRL